MTNYTDRDLVLFVKAYPPEPWRMQYHCPVCASVGRHWGSYSDARDDLLRHMREAH